MVFNSIASIISPKNQLTLSLNYKKIPALINPRPPSICRVGFGLFNSKLFIGIYGMVIQPQNFEKGQKCIEAWSIFMEDCTPALTSSAISPIAYLRPKNEMALMYVIFMNAHFPSLFAVLFSRMALPAVYWDT